MTIKRKAKTLLIIFVTVILLLLLIFIFPINREFHILREREGRVKVPHSISSMVIEDTKAMNIYEIGIYCSKVTCDLLRFSFKQDVLFKNKVSKAHCVTYARLHATLCNIAYNAHDMDAMAIPVVGYAVLNFVNINKLCTALVPKEYERYFIDHDAVEIRCKSSGETLWIIDPTERDYMIWGGIYEKEQIKIESLQ